MKRWVSIVLQILLVVIIILSGLMVTRKLIATKQRIKKIRPREIAPLVTVARVRQGPVDVVVIGNGTVGPSTEIEIVPQVSGKVVYVSDNLVGGGRFSKDETLIRLDDSDYIAALKKAEAELKAQQARLHQLRVESAEAEREWKEANPDLPAPPLLLKLPEIEATEAAIEAARASLQRARLDLQRTEIKAPFSGVVVDEDVGVGQYLRAGQAVARVFSIDRVEIKVSLNDRDAGYVEIPGFNTRKPRGSPAEVEATIGGRLYKWHGYIGRAEIIDEKTRTIPVVVVVRAPYASLPPLAVGTFVRTRMKGRTIEGAAVVEKSAVQWTEKGEPFVWIVNARQRINRRMIQIVRSTDGRYIVSRGLKDGELVVVTPPPGATEGMKVRIES